MIIEQPPPITNRPYPPPSTLITVLQRMRSRNLPDRIDAEYLRDAGVPDSLNSRTLFAFRFLGLVVDERPTEPMRALATSTDEEYRSILSRLIKDAYHEVFEVIDPEQDSQDRILNFFRRYTPASQRSRMVNFFLGMCKEAGFTTIDTPRLRPSSGTAKTKRPNPSMATIREPRTVESVKVEKQPSTPSKLSPALELLLHSLPPEGTPMSETRRTQWLEMARATLAYVYPDEGDEATMHKQEEGKEDRRY